MSVWICLCSLWRVGKAVLSSLLTSATVTPVFVNFSLLSLLYCLSLKTKLVWCFLLHDSSQVQCRIQVYVHLFLPFASSVCLDSCSWALFTGSCRSWRVLSYCGLSVDQQDQSVTSHTILKRFRNLGMGTAALEEGAVSQNSSLIKVHKKNFYISVLWLILCCLRAYLTNPLFNSCLILPNTEWAVVRLQLTCADVFAICFCLPALYIYSHLSFSHTHL